MSKIEEITCYSYDGKLYSSEEKAQQAEKDNIAEYIERVIFSAIVLHPGEKLKLMQVILENRSRLSVILSRE